jgi:hypothetical protein
LHVLAAALLAGEGLLGGEVVVAKPALRRASASSSGVIGGRRVGSLRRAAGAAGRGWFGARRRTARRRGSSGEGRGRVDAWLAPAVLRWLVAGGKGCREAGVRSNGGPGRLLHCAAMSSAAATLEVLRAAAEVLAGRGGPAALATVIARTGSAPQVVGARLLLRADGVMVGTVGGGAIEQQVLAACRSALRDGSPQVVKAHLVRDLGMCCGGAMEVFVEYLDAQARLVLIGGGHVAQALAPVARGVGFRVVGDRRPRGDPGPSGLRGRPARARRCRRARRCCSATSTSATIW